MKKKVKLIAALVLVAAVAAGGVWYALRPLAVEAVETVAATATITLTEQGSYVYDDLYTVYPIVAGEILEVRVRRGDAVRAGDVLAVVDASDYQNQIAQLSSSIAGYQGQIAGLWQSDQQQRDSLAATLAGLEGQLAALEAEIALNRQNADSLAGQIMVQEQIVYTNERYVRYAREDVRDARDNGDDDALAAARQAENTARNTLAQSELLLEQLLNGEVPEDLYQGQKQAIQAQMAVVEAQMGKSYSGGMQQYYNAQIAAAQSAIAQMEEKAGKAEIAAPVDGIVSALPGGDKNFISQAEPLALIGAQALVEVFVPVREIDGIREGDAVELLLDKRLGEEVLPGTVIEVEEEAQIRLSALGVEERRVRVLVRPDAQGLQIGYEADVRFTVYTRENAITLPKTALFEREDGASCLWVIQNGVLARREVEKGIETRDGYLVEGLEPGVLVVRDANQAGLGEGKRVA